MNEADRPSPRLGAPGIPGADEPRPHRRRGASARGYLIALGLLLLLLAFWPGLLARLDEQFGPGRLVAAALGLLFLYCAYLAWEVGRLRERVLDLLEAVLQIFYGPDFRQQREAVDILVRAMETEDAAVRQSVRQHLARLTGEDLGDDGARWAEWWAERRSTFRAPGRGDDGR